MQASFSVITGAGTARFLVKHHNPPCRPREKYARPPDCLFGQGNATLKPAGDRFVGEMSGSTGGDPFSGTINARFKAPL